jgi:DNA topoisomerase-1
MVNRKKLKEHIEKENQRIVPIMNPSDVRMTTEIPIKHIEVETVEFVGKKKVKTKSVKKKSVKSAKKTKKIKTEDEEMGEIDEMKGKKDYTLIITEKPQAAAKIAYALGKGKERKLNISGVAYYEFKYNDEKIVVSSAVGHLLTLNQTTKGSGYPIFDIEWIPAYSKKNGAWTKRYFQALMKLCKNARNIIIATDYDIEGEVIGLNIIRHIAKRKDAKRMKFSTLTSKELEESYNNVANTLNWPQGIAGETRHYLDWMYGINLSRALMSAIKSVGKFKIMSIGRVQGPALHLIVEKEMSIQKFVSTPYWQVYIIVSDGKNELELKFEKDIIKKTDLVKFDNLKGKKAEAKTDIKEQTLSPLTPFDLTTLQLESYKFFGINPNITLQIAQNLYLSGVISYPRTSSQKIPEAINPKNIISKLSGAYDTSLCVRSAPIEGKKSDPAHPSISPTGETPEGISTDERKIYDLIVRRFLSCFAPDAIIENKIVSATVNGLRFLTRGMEIKEKGWLEIYKAKMNEKEIPTMNGMVSILDQRTEEKMTQPPHRYTQASIISELEKRNLGTKATRSSIIQTLYDRSYVKGQSIEATSLGISLIETLKKYSNVIIDEKLTRKFEKEMESIQVSTKNLNEKQEKIITEAKEVITSISKEFKEKESKIGEELMGAETERRQIEKKEAELIECKKCGKGKLRILFNKNFKRYFVACSNYPECKTTFTLPNGLVKRTDKVCEACGWPKLLLIKKARRPWEFCFNPLCPSRKEQEAKEKEETSEDV